MGIRNAATGVLAAAAAAGIVAAALAGHALRAQGGEGAPVEQSAQELAARKAAEEAASSAGMKDPYQRSFEIYTYSTVAKSGWQRGEELYYIKCWFCHNQYAKTGPLLGELFPGVAAMGPAASQKLETAVVEKIRKGGEKMPAYGAILTDADMADLVAYIKSGKCCFDAENPPANPRYIAGSPAGVGTPAGGRK